MAQPTKKKSTGRVTPAKKRVPTDDQITSVSDWKATSGLVAKPTKMPSGKTALVRLPGMQAFVTAGIVPNSLMAIITDAMNTGKEPDMAALAQTADSAMITDIMGMVDSVTIFCVVEPVVYAIPIFTVEQAESGECDSSQVGQDMPPSLRDPDRLYVDEVDIEDKMYIFNLAGGGTADLTQFRTQLEAGVGAIRDGQDGDKPAKRASGARKR